MQGSLLLNRRMEGTEFRVPFSWIGEWNGLNAPSAWKAEWKVQNAGFPPLGLESGRDRMQGSLLLDMRVGRVEETECRVPSSCI